MLRKYGILAVVLLSCILLFGVPKLVFAAQGDIADTVSSTNDGARKADMLSSADDGAKKKASGRKGKYKGKSDRSSDPEKKGKKDKQKGKKKKRGQDR